jgi:hypothetical protein
VATSKKANLGPTKKLKPSGNVKFIKDYVFDPTSKLDIISVGLGGPTARAGRSIIKAAKDPIRAVGGITKKGSKFVGKVYRNMGR